MAKRTATVGNIHEFFIKEGIAYNRTPSTIRGYRDGLKRLVEFMPDIESKHISIMDLQFVSTYTSFLKQRHLSDSSVNAYLRSLRSFLYWCVERSYIKPLKVKLIKEKNALKVPYDADELQLLLRKPDMEASFVEWRDWAIINWVLGVASRVSTIANVAMSDLDLSASRVILRHNKDGDIHAVDIPPQLKRVLVEYMRHMPENATYLFCNQSGGRLLPGGISQSIAKYNKSRGVSRTSIHLVRHTYGKMWAENGGDVFGLQKAFHHTDIRMTQKYVNLYSQDSDLSRTLAFNPLENFGKHPKSRR